MLNKGDNMSKEKISVDCDCGCNDDSSHGHGISCGCGCEHEFVKNSKDGRNRVSTKKDIAIVLRILFSLVGIIVSKIITNQAISLYCLIFSAITCGVDLIFSCVKAICKKQFFNENLLMIIASITAFIIGEGFEGALIITLYRVGSLLEDIAIRSSQNKLDSVMKIGVDKVHLVSAEGIIDVAPDKIEIGSLIHVNKGEKVPLDGILLCGCTEFDVKAITGESKYQTVKGGDNVFSGSVNLGESAIIKVTKIYAESTCQKIVKMVEEAQDKKAKAQKFISKFAKVYTPIVCAVTFLIAVIPPLIDNYNFSKWIYKALAFLVVSCPCALVISVPLSFFIGIGALAKRGVIVKSSIVLENVADVDLVAFDKTGTITYGDFEVKEIFIYNNADKEKVIEYASALEKFSSHPIANVISSCRKTNLIVQDVKEMAGCGVSGVINGDTVVVGNKRLMQAFGVNVVENNSFDLCVYVCINGQLVGEFSLKDKIKENSKFAIALLKKSGVKKTTMLSGDLKKIVSEVCDKVGIDEWKSDLMPEQKVEMLNIFKTQGRNVAYVGDGINDSPSIASADVGIAMGVLGSDIAVENADVVIIDDNLEKISQTIIHSKKVINVVKQNIFFSLATKFFIMALSLFIKLTMGIAMFADIGVMLLAVLNSFRCNKIKKSA